MQSARLFSFQFNVRLTFIEPGPASMKCGYLGVYGLHCLTGNILFLFLLGEGEGEGEGGGGGGGEKKGISFKGQILLLLNNLLFRLTYMLWQNAWLTWPMK